MSASITIVDLKKSFGDKIITNGVNLTIPEKKMTCIVGQSGEGKSVLLKQIIGLIKPTSGHIFIDDIDITKLRESEMKTIFQKCGYVFQFAALLDSLTIFENIGLPLLEAGASHAHVLQIVKEKLSQVHLSEDVLNKYPAELSGGMRKRAGIARALMTNPEIILFDEPTTGLDPVTTRIIHSLLYEMQQRLQMTSVIISHDIEIFKYVDNVALLQNGSIQFFGPAKTIWESDNPYIYKFIRGLV